MPESVFNEFVHGGHLVALSVSSSTFTTIILLGLPPKVELIAAAYLFAYATYALNRNLESTHDLASNENRARHLQSHRRERILTIWISYAAAILLTSLRTPLFVLALTLLLVLSYAYSVGLKNFGLVSGKSRLKEKFLVKNVVISFGWGALPFLLTVYYGVTFSLVALGVFLFLFSRVFIISVFCDVKDIAADASLGIKTIPILLGRRRSWNLLLVLNTISGIYIVLAASWGLLPPTAHFLNASTGYGYYFILKSKSPAADMCYLSDVVADSEDLMYPPLLLMGTRIL